MCSNMIPCPLCSQPAFVNSDSLRLALVSVATRHLTCPVCSELLLGLDKLTIHMFGHLHGLLQEKPPPPCSTIFPQNNETTHSNSNSLLLSPTTPTNLNNNSLVSNYVLTTSDTTVPPKSTNCILPKTQNYVICDNNILTTNILTPITTIQTTNANFNANVINSNNNVSNSPPVKSPNTNEKTVITSNHKSKTKNSAAPAVYPCDICAFKFNDKKILEMHKNLVHSKVEFHKNGQTILPCHLCSKKFRMRGSLMIHLRVAHYGLPNLLKNNNNNNNSSSNNNLNKLDGVEQECNNEDSHLTCNICNKTFLKQQQLAIHLKTHDNKQWECDVCSKMFTTKYFLKKHKRLHTGEMPYHCSQCNKAFTFQQSYHKHMLYHSSEKPHTCGQCGRAFKELSTLHNHERIHSGERPFSCETCGKCFRQRVSCLVHRRIHTGAMPYHCTACGKKFRYKVSQRTHKCPSQPPGIVVRTETGDFLQKILESTYTNKKNNLKSPTPPKVSSPVPAKSIQTTVQTAVSPPGSTISPTINILDQQFVNMGGEISSDNNEITDKHLEVIKNTDFFSLVLSPMDISSPSEKLQNLCLSNSSPQSNCNNGINDEKTSDSDVSGKRNISFDTICTNITNTEFPTNENLRSDPLQTINEESLKQLLYGTTNVTRC